MSDTTAAYRKQRDADIEFLKAVIAQIPRPHHDVPGLIRAVELLRSEPLTIDAPGEST